MQPHLKQGIKRNIESLKLAPHDKCWICEGWTEVEFIYAPDEWIDEDNIATKLHLSLDLDTIYNKIYGTFIGHNMAKDEARSAEAERIH